MTHIETDHEFKTRMAAEGRAIYSPGKTLQEIKAERRGQLVSLEVYEGDLRQMQQDAEDANITLSLVYSALDYLSRAAHEEEDGISAVLELISRAANHEQAYGAERGSGALRNLIDKQGEASA
jgi:hypothetical protein